MHSNVTILLLSHTTLKDEPLEQRDSKAKKYTKSQTVLEKPTITKGNYIVEYALKITKIQ